MPLPCVSIKTRAIPYRKPEPFEVHWLGGCAGLWAAPVPLKSNSELRVWLGQWQTETMVDWFGPEEGERWQINLLSLDSDLRQRGEGKTREKVVCFFKLHWLYFAADEEKNSMLKNSDIQHAWTYEKWCYSTVHVQWFTYFYSYGIWFDSPLSKEDYVPTVIVYSGWHIIKYSWSAVWTHTTMLLLPCS